MKKKDHAWRFFLTVVPASCLNQGEKLLELHIVLALGAGAKAGVGLELQVILTLGLNLRLGWS